MKNFLMKIGLKKTPMQKGDDISSLKPGDIVDIGRYEGRFLDGRHRFKFDRRVSDFPEKFKVRYGSKSWDFSRDDNCRCELVDILVKNGNNKGTTVLINGKFGEEKLIITVA